MNLIIIWSNGDKYKEKNVPEERVRELMKTLRDKGISSCSWGGEKMLLNLAFAREIYLE